MSSDGIDKVLFLSIINPLFHWIENQDNYLIRNIRKVRSVGLYNYCPTIAYCVRDVFLSKIYVDFITRTNKCTDN